MKRFFAVLLVILTTLTSTHSFAQNYNREKNAWVNFVVRMYNSSPFEGVKVVDDATSQHLIVIFSLDSNKYGGNESTMDRVAAVKAQSQASRFFNGSNITTDIVINTTESNGKAETELLEIIKENSIGLVKSLELLTTFVSESNTSRKVYIFSTPVKK